MDETRFDSLTRVFGVSADRRGAARTVAGGAAALAALAAGVADAKKKKKKKKKSAPEPLSFMAIAITSAHFNEDVNDPEVNWGVDGFYFHSASQIWGNFGGFFQTAVELPPDRMRAALVRNLQIAVSSSLA